MISMKDTANTLCIFYVNEIPENISAADNGVE